MTYGSKAGALARRHRHRTTPPTAVGWRTAAASTELTKAPRAFARLCSANSMCDRRGVVWTSGRPAGGGRAGVVLLGARRRQEPTVRVRPGVRCRQAAGSMGALPAG